MTQDELVIAYVDGELDSDARTRFETKLAADPALAAKVARHRRLAQEVNATYAAVLTEPAPPHLVAVATAANDMGARRAGAPAWAGIAASLAVGFVVGGLLWPKSEPLVASDEGLLAKGRLAQALSVQLAGEPGPVQIGLSFKTAEGRYCRTFQSAPDHLAGLACREGEGWVARTVTSWRPRPRTAYRMAGDDTPAEIVATVDALIAGQALDAAAERDARGRGWR